MLRHSSAILWVILAIVPASSFATAASLEDKYGDIILLQAPRQLPEELHRAKVVTPARIVAYEENGLQFQPLPGPARIISTAYPIDINESNENFTYVRSIHDPWPPERETDLLAGQWVPIGAEVLVVVGNSGVVAFLAYRTGDLYRFWFPGYVGTILKFECRPPARPLPRNELPHQRVGDDFTSWDGCLMPVSAVMTKGVKR